MKANEALTALNDCEKTLRRLLGEAAAEGDYTSVQQITGWAKAVAALTTEGQPHATPSSRPAVSRKDANGKHSSGERESGRRSGHVPDQYPKFFRRGVELVRVGWSKTERREYNHRAPRAVLDAVSSAVKDIGGRGKLFNGDALLPLKDPVNGGGNVPDYQVYVALGWLKELGLVQQRGRRGGYTVDREKQIDSTITAAWPELAEWQG